MPRSRRWLASARADLGPPRRRAGSPRQPRPQRVILRCLASSSCIETPHRRRGGRASGACRSITPRRGMMCVAHEPARDAACSGRSSPARSSARAAEDRADWAARGRSGKHLRRRLKAERSLEEDLCRAQALARLGARSPCTVRVVQGPRIAPVLAARVGIPGRSGGRRQPAPGEQLSGAGRPQLRAAAVTGSPRTTFSSCRPPSSDSGIADGSTDVPSSTAWATPRERRSGLTTSIA